MHTDNGGGDYCPNCDTGHIGFTCLNHPELEFSGKNIFGRSLFFFGMKPGHGFPTKNPDGTMRENNLLTAEGRVARECDCSASMLVHVCPVDGLGYKNGKVVPLAVEVPA